MLHGDVTKEHENTAFTKGQKGNAMREGRRTKIWILEKINVYHPSGVCQKARYTSIHDWLVCFGGLKYE